jgi:hypothetical protein
MVDASTPSAVTGPVPIMDELAMLAVPAVKTTLPPVRLKGEAMERVFVSAFLEARVQLESPAELEMVQLP